MKTIIMFSGKEYLVENREADLVAENFNSGALMKLRSGARINPKGIESIDEPETEAFWGGYPLSKDGKSFMRDGQRIYLEQQNFKEIEYRIHSKYKIKSNKLLN